MTVKEAILQLPLRADKNDDDILVATFVQIGAVMPLLLSKNNHVLFGRRGTGKTHVLKYLHNTLEDRGDIGIYIDMRLIGSSNSLYSDKNIPQSQRTLRLMSDVLKEIHDGIIKYLTSHQECSDLAFQVVPLLEELLCYGNEERIEGQYSFTTSEYVSQTDNKGCGVTLSLDPGMSISRGVDSKKDYSSETTVFGNTELYMDYQYVYACLEKITQSLAPKRIWILIDEFSEVDPDMQVYLADMFKRVFAPNNSIIFKIAAIEHRSSFIRYMDNGGYCGLEVGADISSCNLDNYLVFGNNEAVACHFYRELLLSHINSMLDDDKKIKASDDLIGLLFTQENAFVELVDAAEGVPRDAFNILAKAIALDYDNRISIPTLRKAARLWYVQDKQKSVEAYPGAFDFLSWIIEVVINKRHAKAFLLKSGTQQELIHYLYDARILHVIKQSISSRDTPGERYDVYSIDYGCYCDLINTARQPKGLFEAIEDSEDVFVDVPKDDYRSIRRAILDISECPYIINKSTENSSAVNS